ncbi:transporter [Xanthomonas arboricola]|uniref:transporter n=1 Tax=Xanthomonas arboricola TaxID=56448 RepID=UPI000CEE1796|nr:transporter [Xanthomonas arboricola]PPU39795.1 phenol degradation protein meta [Xanthomonas arboricola pv. populi]
MHVLRPLLAVFGFCAFHAQAIEVAPGDYEQLPAGTTAALVYYQHSTTDALYTRGRRARNDFDLTSDVGILRLLHVFRLGERVTVDPQVLLPFGHVSGGGDAAALGSAEGVADLILAAPLRYRLNAAGDVLALTPYLYLPTGRYDRNDALNLGENRWKLDLQAAYVRHFSPRWALDLVGDVIWYGDNDDLGASSSRLEQDVSYSVQAMGRYMPTAATAFGLGLNYGHGGRSRVDGIDQDDRRQTTQVRFTVTQFVSPKDQLQLQLGRDVAVDNGPREDFRMNLRYLRVF